MNPSGGRFRVHRGGRPDGLAWEIVAEVGPDGLLYTFVDRTLGNARAESGFGGKPLETGRLVDFWYGQADGTPFFVLARAAPEVEGVVAVCASGVEYPLDLSDVDPRFGLRFGAVPLPPGEELIAVRTVPPSPIAPVHRPHGRNWLNGGSSEA